MRAAPDGGRIRDRLARRLRAVTSMEGFWKELRRLEDAELPGICTGVFLYPADIGRPSALRIHHPFAGRREAEVWRLPFDRDAAVAYLKANPGCGPFRLHEIEATVAKNASSPALRTPRGDCGCHYRLVTPLWDGVRLVGAACFHRRRDQGDYSDKEIALLARLQPRLSAVATRLLRLGALRLRLRCLRAAADSLTEPMAAYDPPTGLFRATGGWKTRALEEGPRGRRFEERVPADIAAAAPAAGTGARARVPGRCGSFSISRLREGRLLIRAKGGASPPRIAAAVAVGLTPAERDILAGIGRGLTNREIAARRGTSPHTVHHQISILCGKLGAPNRYALAASARSVAKAAR